MHLKLKSGNIELSSDENSEIEAIFKEEMRFRGRQKSEEKKKKRQMTKKAKHMLKMVKNISNEILFTYFYAVNLGAFGKVEEFSRARNPLDNFLNFFNEERGNS